MSQRISTPTRLKNIYDFPEALYIRGSYDEKLPAVAVVGSRNCSSEGEQTAKELGRLLAKQGIAIVSGLARGIDKAAHIGALEASGITYAVIPSGIDSIYPASHSGLARRIEISGALISERAGNYNPMRHDFLARNRLISGLADYVIIVEAAARSGALNTARHALEQGRELVVVPGSIYSANSSGTNDLIRQGATPLTSVMDIFNVLGIKTRHIKDKPFLNSREKLIVNELRSGPKTQNHIINVAKLATSEAASLITKLEVEGVIERAPGNYLFLRQ